MALEQEVAGAARGLQAEQNRSRSLVSAQSVCGVLVAIRGPLCFVEIAVAAMWLAHVS